MSNISKYSILKAGFICLFSLLVVMIYGQRNVIWAHGLQETNQAWQLYATHFETIHTSINTVNESYTSNNGMVNAANEIKQDLDNQLGSGNTNINNIGIAHGTAGLAYRQIDGTTSTTNKRFGGFITMGTPHKGVYFADAQVNGDLAAYTIDANDKLKLNAAYLKNGQIWTDTDLANYGQTFASQHLGTNPTSIDLLTNSSFLNNLSSSFSKPVINIYGNENAKSQWRLFSSFEEKPYTLSLDAQGNNNILEAANDIEAKYKSTVTVASISLIMIAVTFSAGIYYSVPLGTAAVIVSITYGTTLATIYSFKLGKAIKGRNWFRDAEKKWKHLNGAIRTQTYTYTFNGIAQNCLNQINQYGWGWYYGNPQNQQGCYTTTTVNGIQHINEKGDGLIPYSSTLLPPNPNIISLEVAGANHFELYNHASVRQRLNEIFIGQHGPFFLIQ